MVVVARRGRDDLGIALAVLVHLDDGGAGLRAVVATRLLEIIGTDSLLSFSRRCGVNEGTLRNIIKSGANPRSDHLVAVADAANVSIEWLATGRGPKWRKDLRAAGEPAKSMTEIFDAAYSERVQRPATGTLPELLRQDIPEENEYFNVLWPLFSHLWATRQLRWLPDHITLEQAAGLVSEAAELSWLRARGQPRGDKVNPQMDAAFARTVLHKAWVVHMADEPTEDEADESPSPGMS